jgi:hypothetical protein
MESNWDSTNQRCSQGGGGGYTPSGQKDCPYEKGVRCVILIHIPSVYLKSCILPYLEWWLKAHLNLNWRAQCSQSSFFLLQYDLHFKNEDISYYKNIFSIERVA